MRTRPYLHFDRFQGRRSSIYYKFKNQNGQEGATKISREKTILVEVLCRDGFGVGDFHVCFFGWLWCFVFVCVVFFLSQLLILGQSTKIIILGFWP